MNNFAISTSDLASSLTKSASALVTAGVSFEQASALLTGANTIMQDPDSVSQGLKIISLRIRGVKTELEEMGEETGDVLNTSKLQEKIKALTGVDIIDEEGGFRNIYDILMDIADVWDELDSMSQAAVVEAMAGKNRANVFTSLMMQAETIKEAYGVAMDAEGSAIAENEKYLDSIQGKVDQFTNALQTTWNDLIGSDFIKGIVDMGTAMLGLAKPFNLFITSLGALAAYKGIFKAMPFLSEFGTGLKNTVKSAWNPAAYAAEQAALESLNAAKVRAAILSSGLNATKQEEIANTLLSASADGTETVATDLNTAAKIRTALATIGVVGAEADALITSMGLGAANTATAITFDTLTTAIGRTAAAIGTFLVTNPVGWAILAAGAIAATALFIDAVDTSTEEHAEKLKNLKTEYQDIEDTITSLQGELKTTKERMKELLALGDNRSFAQDEELKKLQQKNAELQRELDLQIQLKKLKQEETNKEFVSTMESALNDKAEFKGSGYSTQKESAERNLNDYLMYKQFYEEATNDYIAAMKDGDEKAAKQAKRTSDFYKQQMDNRLSSVTNFYEALKGYTSGIEYIDNPTTYEQKTVNAYLDYYNNLADKINIALGSDGAVINAFNRVSTKTEFVDDLDYIKEQGLQTGEALREALKFNEDGTLAASEGDLNAFIQTLIDCGFIADATAESLQKVMDAIYKTGQFDPVNFDPSFNIADYETSIDKVQSSISTYRSALESLESGNFTYDEFIDLVQQFPELADGVDASSKSFNGLSKNLRKAIKNAPDDLIDSLKDLREQMKLAGKDTAAIDQMISSLENLPTDQLDSLAAKYGLVADAMSEAARNANELSNALSQDTNTGYTTRIEAMTEMKNLLAQGATGSESKLWNIAEEFFGKDARALFKEGSDALYEAIQLREQWYQESEDGAYSRGGIESFMNYMANDSDVQQALANLGATWEFDGQEFKFNFNGHTFKEIADAINEVSDIKFSDNELIDLMRQVGQFANISWTDGKDVEAYFKSIESAVGDAQGRLKEATDVMSNFLSNNDLDTEWLSDMRTTDAFKALPEDIQKALEAYYDFKKSIEADPLDLSKILNADDVADGISKESVAALNQLVDVMHEDITDTTWLSFDELRTAAKNAGYADDAVENLISRLEEYDNVLDLSVSKTDPLGLLGMSENARAATIYLNELGIQASNMGGTVQIDLSQFIGAMQNAKMSAEDTSNYINSLLSTGSFAFKDGGNVFDISTNADDVKARVDDLYSTAQNAPDEQIKVDLTGNAEQALKSIVDYLESITDKSVTVTVHTEYKNGPGGYTQVNGTAHADGVAHINGTTKGKAFVSGNWGLKHKENDALVGELGMETVVDPNTGRYYTVGDNGAEFVDLPKNAIVFNHKQTEQLFKHGHVAGRGKAYASGNAFISGGNLGKKYYFDDTVEEAVSDGEVSESTDDKEKETLDFIEIKVEEIEALIEKITAKIENFLDDTTDTIRKGEYYDDLVNAEKNKASTFLAAVEVYNKKAADLLTKIPEQYREMAQNGALAIEDFVGDEEKKTIEAVNEYREWAQKADDAEIGYLESIAQVAAYRVEQLEDIADDFENLTNQIETQADLVQSYIDLIKASGNIVSADLYEDLIEKSTKEISILQDKRIELQKILDDSVASGDIIKGTDEWFEMVEAIYEVDSEILDVKKDIEDLNNSILDLHWENFERIQDSLSNISEEASNVREIIRDIDLTDDKGNWTKEGITALGMAAQEMENAKYQADLYNEQIEELNKQFAAGMYSQIEYTEKLAELKDGQWESVKAYESAKDALVDLNKTRIEAVKDGLQKEIDAYEELIEKRKEDLDAQKDAHDWANTVNDLTDERDLIQRQLDAIAGDTSAAGIAQRKKLEEELAKAQRELDEAYYDRDIEMQQKSLDDSLEAYRKDKEDKMEALDEYLEKQDQVIADSYALILANTESVMAGLQEISSRYNISISDNVTSPWESGASALGTYGEELDYATSSYVDMLERVRKELIDIQLQADKTASSILNSLESSEKKTQSATQKTTTTTQTPTANTQPSLATGSRVTVKTTATNFARDGGNGTRMQSWVPGSTFTVYEIDGNEVLIGKPGEGYTGWIRKQDIVGYAKGTTGVKKDQAAWIDEQGLEELVLHADGGKLSYLTKGTSVIPADITKNLMELGQVDYRTILDRNRPSISAPGIIENNMQVDMSIGTLINIEHADKDSIPEIQDAVKKQLDSYMKALNGKTKKYAR